MSVVALLDVNVLVALFDPDHVHHEPAHRWFAKARGGGWATCPLTENGLIRVLSNPAYSPAAQRPGEMARRLGRMYASGKHSFFADEISLCDEARFDLGRAGGHRQLTDVYLLGLAVNRQARLATFDRAIPIPAVVGAGEQHLVLVPA